MDNSNKYVDSDDKTYIPKDGSWFEHLKAFSLNLKSSPKLILVIVFIAIFLDNMLLTTVVPIIPNFLLQLTIDNSEFKANLNKPCRKYIDDLTESHLNNSLSKSEVVTRAGFFKNHSLVRMPPKLNSTICPRSTQIMAQKFVNETLKNENFYVGIMFASKSIVQMLTTPFVGPLTNKIGYSVPLFTGFVIMLISTLGFAFSKSYTLLFVSRAFQGVSSAFTSVSGMGLLATYYPDDEKRGRAFSIALSGLAMGVLLGPPFGGVVYQFTNHSVPFIILAALALFDGLLQMISMKPSIKPEDIKGSSLKDLIRDPYIIIAAGSITFGNMGIGLLEPSLPLWMREQMGASEWEQGAAFLPSSISYLIGTNLFGIIAQKIGRWLSSFIGMLIVGVSLITVPMASSPLMLILPNAMLGFSIGMIDSSMMPIMAHLVDLRHASIYGNVYAIADFAFCLSFAIGPVLSSALIANLGFPWTLRVIAILTLLYAPLNLFLKNPPPIERETKDEKNSSDQKKDEALGKLIQQPYQYDDTIGNSYHYDTYLQSNYPQLQIKDKNYHYGYGE